MDNQKKNYWKISFILIIWFTGMGCGIFSSISNQTLATPTPTLSGGAGILTPTVEQNSCEGLTGTLELQLLIGPSEAVGLEPTTTASIPFSVETVGESYLVSSSGPVDYYEDVYEAEWGSFTVTFEGETVISGECLSQDDRSQLNILLEMAGEQIVTIIVEGTETTFPWSGTPTINASFPLMDGAQAQGEGWQLILHLNR